MLRKALLVRGILSSLLYVGPDVLAVDPLCITYDVLIKWGRHAYCTL